MDSPTASLDFAAIGHQDTWQNILDFINGIRSKDLERLNYTQMKSIFSFIPPREVFRVKVNSKTGSEINGVYIESFIDPESLDNSNIRTNIKKVMESISCAQKLGAKVAALGGFTSIVLEGNLEFTAGQSTKFTTGNTLTAAFIVKGIEKAADHLQLDLSKSNLLVIGATGDIGLACVHYFQSKVERLLLCARNFQRLEKLAKDLTNQGTQVKYSMALDDLVPEADIIISVASSSGIHINACKAHVLVCDAGYPKNLETKFNDDKIFHLFHGGMGQVSEGFSFMPDYTHCIYQYPVANAIHGCILEAMVLAFENKYENYSAGKGNITSGKMEEIYNLSLKHGINLAPFYNSKGVW